MKLKYELIYKVAGEVEVDLEHYPNSTLEVPDDVEITDTKRAELAFEYETSRDEEDLWESFEGKVASDGPTGFYYAMQLLDDEGNAVTGKQYEQAFKEDVEPSLL